MFIKPFYLIAIIASFQLAAADAPAPPPFQPLHPEKLKLLARLGETRFRHASAITAILPMPDGKILLTSRDNSARIWDAKTGAELRRFTSSEDVWGAALLPDGKSVLLSGGDKKITLWNSDSGQTQKTFTGHDSTVFRVAPFAGGKKFIAGSNNTKVLLWDLASATFTELKSASKTTYGVAISPDEKNAAACGVKGAWMWNAQSGELLRQLSGLTDDTYTIAFSPDGKTLATCSGDKTLRLWNVEDGKQLWSISPGLAHVLAFSPTGDRIVISVSESKQNSVRVFAAADGKELLKIEDAYEGSWPCCFSADGNEILAANSTLFRWDAKTGKPLEGPGPNMHSGRIDALALGADGKLYSLGSDFRVIQWDLASGAGKQIFRADAGVNYEMALHAGKRVLLAGREEQSLSAWDVLSGQKIQTVQVKSQRGAPQFSPKQDLLMVKCYSEKLAIFDLENGWRKSTLKLDENSNIGVASVALHNGVLAAGQDDGNLKFWDIATGGELGDISVITDKDKNNVTHCVFMKEGRQLLVAGQNGMISVWSSAAEASAAGGDKPADLRAALKQLGDDDFNTRENAVKILSGGGDRTLKLLDAEPESKDPEVVQRITQVRGQLRKAVLPLQRAANDTKIEDVQNLAVHPDGVRFAITAGDSVDAQLVIGKIGRDGPEIVARIRDGFAPYTLCFGADGKTLYVGNRDSTISVYGLSE